MNTESLFQGIYYRLMPIGVAVISALFAWWGIRLWTQEHRREARASEAVITSVTRVTRDSSGLIDKPTEVLYVTFTYNWRGEARQDYQDLDPDLYPNLKAGDRLSVGTSDFSYGPELRPPTNNQGGMLMTLIFVPVFLGSIWWLIHTFRSEYD